MYNYLMWTKDHWWNDYKHYNHRPNLHSFRVKGLHWLVGFGEQCTMEKPLPQKQRDPCLILETISMVQHSVKINDWISLSTRKKGEEEWGQWCSEKEIQLKFWLSANKYKNKSGIKCVVDISDHRPNLQKSISNWAGIRMETSAVVGLGPSGSEQRFII